MHLDQYCTFGDSEKPEMLGGVLEIKVKHFFIRTSDAKKLTASSTTTKKMHSPGIEPGTSAWKADILPLNYECFDAVPWRVWEQQNSNSLE